MLAQSLRSTLRRSFNALKTKAHHDIMAPARSITSLPHNISIVPPTLSTFDLSNQKMHQLDQKRHMGRRDGNKAFYKTRGPTRKQKKKYHKRMRELHHKKVGRHSKPGSKAGPRREFRRDEHEYLVNRALGKIPRAPEAEDLEFDFGDVLVDDLIGNSAHLASAPTPKPIYLGRQYDKHYSKISGMMQEFHEHLQLAESSDGDGNNPLAPPLPTDKQISLLLRSYRDRNSNRHRPLGIVKALKHLLTDIKIPLSIFGKKTYAGLMSCAASPKEARRVMKMMEDNGLSSDAYIYSILIDIYAKRGDFRGADAVLSEMRFEEIEPTLPAYTSLLAACYKVINTGSMPQAIKAEAGTLAWNRWKEAVINGLELDAMAYGAIIRIMAARGLPEKAINLVEEMQVYEIKPTTLIFTSALKAVARSHANAIRFEGGRSRKNKNREKIVSHHGKMAKSIVVLAEQAGVEQDEGFVSALMQCAGIAGDTATAKAIYLASEVRRLENMRKTGGSEYLQLIRGKGNMDQDPDLKALESGTRNLALSEKADEHQEKSLVEQESSTSQPAVLAYDPRKRRRDTRRLNALLTANANALEKRGLGNVWAGRENKGYLCENSLRLIQARYVPKYVDKSLPGLDSLQTGLASTVWDDEDVEKMGKRLRRKKVVGPLEDQENTRMDNLDPDLYDLFDEGDGDDNDDFLDGEQLEKDGFQEEEEDDAIDWETINAEGSGQKIEKDSPKTEVDLFSDFNEDLLEGVKEDSPEAETDLKKAEKDLFDELMSDEDFCRGINEKPLGVEANSSKAEKGDEYDEESDLFSDFTFDEEEVEEDSPETEVDLRTAEKNLFEELMSGEDFDKGVNGVPSGVESDLSKAEEADVFDEMMSGKDSNYGFDDDISEEEFDLFDKLMSEEELSEDEDKLLKKILSDFEDEDDDEPEKEADELHGFEDAEYILQEEASSRNQEDDYANTVGKDSTLQLVGASNSTENSSIEIADEKNKVTLPEETDDLDMVLYGLPRSRINRVRKEFEKNLGVPSIIQLVPLLRENMPEVIDRDWLISKNLRDATVVMDMAKEDKIADMHMLNSMLQVYAKSGSIEKALEYYDTEFELMQKKPNAFSDRTMFQMLIEKKEISQALAFKENKVEESGRKLDLLSYGSLVEFYGNRGQVGSAMMALKECVQIHGSPPGEKCLKNLRLVCRQREITDEVGLEELIGKDPLEWLRRGEGTLKREHSKRGNRNLLITKNKLLNI